MNDQNALALGVTRSMRNYQSSCPWDICSLSIRDEMLRCLFHGPVWIKTTSGKCSPENLAGHRRSTGDSAGINCAAMEASRESRVLEALSTGPELESLQILKSALDQMRHFLWFYGQMVTNESEFGDRLARDDSPETIERWRGAGSSDTSERSHPRRGRSPHAAIPGRRKDTKAQLTSPNNALLQSNRLHQVTRTIHVQSSLHRHVVRKQLQGHNFQDRRKQLGRLWEW